MPALTNTRSTNPLGKIEDILGQNKASGDSRFMQFGAF